MPSLLVSPSPSTTELLVCDHCGDACGSDRIATGDHIFCCTGCETVFQVLQENNLLSFYGIDQDAGRSQRKHQQTDYAWLDLPKLADRLIRYRDEQRCHVMIELPTIHCASCVWLLERLPDLLTGVRSCTIDFSHKRATVVFDPRRTTLREVAEMLDRIGYPPHLNSTSQGTEKKVNRSLIYRIGVAGFCFGNIMLLSFPEYFGWGVDGGEGQLGEMVQYLILLLSLPVLFYAGRSFFTAAYYGISARKITIDVPIAIGITALFLRSTYEILSGEGAGYLDSLAGLVFFLLIGRWFQLYTFARLNFERDYHDYFPVAAHRLLPGGGTAPIASEDLQAGDRILVKPGQLIPADGRLLSSAPSGIDYSFVTGEAEPQMAPKGKAVYAGGRAITNPLQIEISKTTNQSYLLQLWLNESKQKATATVAPPESLTLIFTVAILLIAALTFGYWYPTDVTTAYRAATAVLIIACPCALALAAPFAYGSLQRLLAGSGYYFRGPSVVRGLASINTFVFDKTGTLVGTHQEVTVTLLEKEEKESIAVFKAMAEQSTHPRSLALRAGLSSLELPPVNIGTVEEVPGCGLRLDYGNARFIIGNGQFCGVEPDTGQTYGTVNGRVILFIGSPAAELRPAAGEMLATLKSKATIYLLSGDHAPAGNFWENHFGDGHTLFQQSPFAKRDFINQLQADGRRVLMIGDGINDAGALNVADVGLAVNEDEASFNPACDGVVKGDFISVLPRVISASHHLEIVMIVTYTLAFLYNIVGLSFAVSGTLSPVVAAILMPLSSISVVLVAVAGAWLVCKYDMDHSGR